MNRSRWCFRLLVIASFALASLDAGTEILLYPLARAFGSPPESGSGNGAVVWGLAFSPESHSTPNHGPFGSAPSQHVGEDEIRLLALTRGETCLLGPLLDLPDFDRPSQ